MARIFVLVVVVALLSGCWLQIGYGPQHRRYNDLEDDLTVDNVASLGEQWAYPRTLHFDEPIVSQGRVFVRDGDTVIAVDAGDGTVLWESPVPGNSPLALSGDALWTSKFEASGPPTDPQCTGALVRLDPATGETAGEEPGVTSKPPVTSGSVVAHVQRPVLDDCLQGDAELLVRDRRTLDVRWSYRFPEGGFGASLPTITDDAIYVDIGPTLYAFPLDCGSPCEPTWTFDLGGVPSRYVVAGTAGQLFVRRPGADTAVLDADTGAVMWTIRGGGQLALADDRLYQTAGGELRVFDANGCGSSECAPVWTATLPSATSTLSPVVAGGVVYVSGNDRTIYAVDAAGCGSEACEPILSLPTEAGPAQELVVSGGTLFAINYASGDSHYELVAYQPGSSL